VIETLTDKHDIARISACKGYRSQCRSTLCPFCTNAETSILLGRVRGACDRLPDHRRSRLRFATFTTADVPTERLREVANTSSAAVLKTLKSLRIPGFVSRLEVSFPSWDDEFHLHHHAILDSPPTGRGYVSNGALTDAWMESLPAELLPPVVVVDNAIVSYLDRVTSYLCESPFHRYVRERDRADIEEVPRTIDAIRELKKLRKITSRGTLQLKPAHCALAA
jgi:hypothetical protein